MPYYPPASSGPHDTPPPPSSGGSGAPTEGWDAIVSAVNLNRAYTEWSSVASYEPLTPPTLDEGTMYRWGALHLALNGRLYAFPNRLSSHGVLSVDPRDGSFLVIDIENTSPVGDYSVLARNGKIYAPPGTAGGQWLVFDTVSETSYLTDLGLGEDLDLYRSGAGALGADGKIYALTDGSDGNFLVIDPTTDTVEVTPLGLNPSQLPTAIERGEATPGMYWSTLVAAPNGKIYGTPYTSDLILVIDPAAGVASVSNMGLSTDTTSYDYSYWGYGVLGADEKIYCGPGSKPSVLVIDTTTDTAVETDFGLDLTRPETPEDSFWASTTLGPDGNVYLSPLMGEDFLVIDTKNNTARVDDFGIEHGPSPLGGPGPAIDKTSLGPDGDIYMLTFASPYVWKFSIGAGDTPWAFSSLVVAPAYNT